MSGRHTGNFTSYVKEAAIKDEIENHFCTTKKLLPGEIEAARASNVCLYVAQKKKPQKSIPLLEDRLGTLIITNFRLSFSLVENTNEADMSYQENNFLGKYDVSLSNIEKIYQISDKKKRLVGPDHKNSSKVDVVRVICKNFRLLTFDFRASDIGKGKYIADALLRFAFPSQHNHLFLYHFRAEYYNTVRSIRLFNQENDWVQEMRRCGVPIGQNGWRIQYVDRLENPELTTLPRCFVVPHSLSTSEYIEKSRFFRQNRAAIWVWGRQNASLIRMADLLESATDRTEENIMLECVRKCDPNRKPPKIVELDKLLPSIQDIYQSYAKLMELCAPESDRQFMVQDNRFYSLLEKSCWLLYASLCLKQAKDLSKRMMSDETIVLQETEGRDMCCLVSSLIQLLLDPYARTLQGFQTLIQKEWVSLGHPFCDRMGHISKKNNAEQGPLFLLFLDCTWQLLQQYPESFEFSETFLTTLWDTVFLPIFDTFQFNCEADRERAIKENIILRPVWDWGEQFSDRDIALFSNPLYKRVLIPDGDLVPRVRASLAPSHGAMRLVTDELKQYMRNQGQPDQNVVRLSKNVQQLQLQANSSNHFLDPKYKMRDLEVWSQCYFRWIPMLEVKHGGFPQIDLFNRILINNIHRIQKCLADQSDWNNTHTSREINDEVSTNGPKFIINSFFPFTNNMGNSVELSDMLTTNIGLLTDGSLYDTASLAFHTND